MEVFEPADGFDLSAYDATYVALADKSYILVTGDKKLYRALKGGGRVKWIGDYV